jgi:hypothetical protein
MGVLLNHPCMNQEEFETYKDELESTPSSPVYKQIHQGVKDYWTWPALILTNISFTREPPGMVITYHHTSVSQSRLLKVLGLSQEEFKLEFNKRAPEQVPEISEQREV